MGFLNILLLVVS
jgi:integral membrane protein